ncbi:site-specific integrase [Niabella insulamsoli]|uniref:site-specific integrase n=1 Tax=Niabella insulamsoli TaxID=3144874 RepID=UPI0031FBD68E
MLASTSIFIDASHPKTDGTCAISLRVTYDRKRRYYPIKKYVLTAKEFDKIMNAKRQDNMERANIKTDLEAYKIKADDIIKKMPFFTFDGFADRYLENKAAADTLTAIYEAKIKELTENGQIGTATTYRNAIQSLNAYKKNIAIGNVTASFLKAYSKWMHDAGKSKNTISMYLRTLRTIFNEQIGAKQIDKDLYPFRRQKNEKAKYAPPAPVKRKRALTDGELSLLYYYEPTMQAQIKALDFWKLSFLCSGMNFTDILNLKVKEYDGEFIRFFRQKTDETDEPTEIIVHVDGDAKAIINKYRIHNVSPNAYLFPFLTKEMDAETLHKRVKSFISQTNKQLKKICAAIGIQHVSTYHARHSFANKLKQGGIDIGRIQEALGHASAKTTATYLKSFNDEAYKEISAAVKPLKIAK